MAKRKPKPDGWNPDNPLNTEARQRFLEASSDDTNRRQWEEDARFKALKQWDPAIEEERARESRPCFVIDQIGPAVRQVCNAQRQSAPAVRVIPVDSGADQDTAEVFEGLCRHIQDRSQAQLAYDWAFEDAASFGLGWLRLLTVVDDPATKAQRITIGRVMNRMAVYPDPAAVEPTFSDMRYLFYVQDFAPDEYKRRWPHSQLASLEEFTSLGNDYKGWFLNGRIRVAEYWRIEYADGGDMQQGQVLCDTINACESLDHKEWAGKYLPWIPAIGEEQWFEGRRLFRGIFRAARDPQKLYNYERTSLTEQVALAKRPDVIADADQIEPYRTMWESRTTKNLGALYYKTKSVDGNLVPPPSFESHAPNIEGTVVAINLARQDLHAVTQYYDQSDPNRKNADQSGRAIQARFESAQVGNSHYLDNFTTLTLRWLGVQLVDLIPKIYDDERVVRILGRDDKPQTVLLNRPFVKGPDGMPQPVDPSAYNPKAHKFFQLENGRYDVTIAVGQNTSTRRQETVETGLRLMETLQPPQSAAIADLVVENMDGAGHQQIAARLKKLLPPQLQEKDGQQDPAQQVQQLQQKLDQAMQILDLTTKELEARTEQVKQETVKVEGQADMKRMEIASRERIEGLKIAADLAKTEATINAQAANQIIGAELQKIQSLLEAQQAGESARADREHELGMSAVGAVTDQAAGDQQHQQAIELGGMQHQQGLEAAQQQAALRPPAQAGA